MKFHFGKYKDYRVDETPSTYLIWCIDNCESLTPELKKEIRDEIVFRYSDSVVNIEKSNIRSHYILMCKKYHPDAGGTDDQMKAINEFYTLLKNG